MSKGNPLVILGGGGLAREVVWHIRDINKQCNDRWNIVGFWVHEGETDQRSIGDIPVVRPESLAEYLPNLFAVAAIGNPRFRERAVSEAERLGCKFATLIHPSVKYDEETVTIGTGSIICVGSTLTVDISLGKHVIINPDCSIGHDSIIEDFVTLSPGCHISGNNHIGRGAFLGTGAVTIEKRRVGSSSIVGAGAVVVRDIQDGTTATGVPAKEAE